MVLLPLFPIFFPGFLPDPPEPGETVLLVPVTFFGVLHPLADRGKFVPSIDHCRPRPGRNGIMLRIGPFSRKPRTTREGMAYYLTTDCGHARYKVRGTTVEPTFGQIKENRDADGSWSGDFRTAGRSGASSAPCTTSGSSGRTRSPKRPPDPFFRERQEDENFGQERERHVNIPPINLLFLFNR